MGLAKMAPDGWAYYAQEIASGREDYFAREEIGRWVGEGARRLGLSEEVSSLGLERLFAEARHPESGEALGRPYGTGRSAVAGYALSFSPPKSVSVVWALGDEDVSREVRASHDAAVSAALSYLERHAAFTRRGKAGRFQADTAGLLGAAFVHRTSRALDPQLHTHLLLANKVEAATDGSWLSLDGAELYRHQKAAGMLYKAALRTELSTRLGVAWSEVDRHGIAEIQGVPNKLIEHWSTRRHQVTEEAARLIAGREAALGRPLSDAERSDAHQLAAYRTRGAKAEETRSEAELRQGWATEAQQLGLGPEQWLGSVLEPRQLGSRLSQGEAVERALEVLEESSSTWSRAEATEVLSTLLDHRSCEDAATLQLALEDAVDALLAHGEVLTLTVASLDAQVESLRRDGLARHVHHGTVHYSTRTTLAREAEVLEAAAAGVDAGIAVVPAARLVRLAEALGLGTDQSRALERVCGSGEAICALVGPAGAGKSKMLEAARAGFESCGHRVIGLAPSAMAVEVLQHEAGIGSETLARFLLQTAIGADHLRAGDVVVLDEATMAKSADLCALVRITRAAGAKLVAVGDPAQLGAVGPGGLFRTLAKDTKAAELDTLRRFVEPWEREALLRLRAHDPSVVATYRDHGRITGAGFEEAVELAFTAWCQARAEGKQVLMMAADHETVDALALSARAARVAAGEVERSGVRAGRHVVGVGDEVVSLRNDRSFVTGAGAWVRNGDRWTVTARLDDGSLEVAHVGQGGSVRLPSSYVTEHLALGYALTVHKVQGTTVDRAVVVVDAKMSAQQLYVAMSRGREHNSAVFVCEAPDTGHGRFATPSSTEVLARVLRHDGADLSATELIRQEQIRTLDPEGRIAALEGPDLGLDLDETPGLDPGIDVDSPCISYETPHREVRQAVGIARAADPRPGDMSGAQQERQRLARQAQARALDRRRRSESRGRGGRGRGR